MVARTPIKVFIPVKCPCCHYDLAIVSADTEATLNERDKLFGECLAGTFLKNGEKEYGP